MGRLQRAAERIGLRRTDQQQPTERRSSSVYYGRGHSTQTLTYGGIVNPATGMGTGLDHIESAFFTPTRVYTSTPFEIICVQSWAARKFVNIPVDDMFIKWRSWAGDDEAAADAMQTAEDDHKVKMKLAKAMKAARQYGTGALVMLSREAMATSPLMPEQIREGDLKNLLALHRFEMSVRERDRDMYSPTYGQPVFYDLFPKGGGHMAVHASRVLKFDGITAATDSGFTYYDWDWGVSELIPVIISLLEDQGIVSNISHLSAEASIPVLSVSNLREALAGGFDDDDPDAPNAEKIAADINRLKSNHRLLLKDKELEEFERVAVEFGGLADLMDRFQGRVAAAADIPQTRWSGRSPAGLNATGDADMDNYVVMVEALREEKLPPHLEVLDMVLARDAGLKEPPEYEWRSMREVGDKDQAETSKLRVETVGLALDKRMVDEDEGRDILRTHDPMFLNLVGDAPEQDDGFDMGGMTDPFGNPIGPAAPPPGNGDDPDDDDGDGDDDGDDPADDGDGAA